MKEGVAAFLIAVVAAAVSFVPKSAEAIPAFARKFQVACDHCHRAFPELNETGERYQELGFQNKSGGDYDGGDKEKSQIDDKLVLEKGMFPVSLRILGDFKTKQESGSTPDTKSRSSLELPHEVELMAGGTLFRNISYWLEIEWEGGASTVAQAYAGFHNITGDNSLNVRAGLIPINRWGLPGTRILAKKNNVRNTSVANDGWKLRGAEQAIEIYGRPADGHFFYNIGLSNGLKGINGEDNNSAKNLFGRIGVNVGEQEFGVLGYFGKNATAGAQEENIFNRVGFDYILRCGNAQIFGQYILGVDNNPTFAVNRVRKHSRGYFINASYLINPSVMALLQFDYTNTENDVTSTESYSGNRTTWLTPGIAYYPTQNLRTVVEYQKDLVKRDSNHTRIEDKFNIRLDFVF